MREKGQGRIMGIDYGRKRVGIALTDPLRIIASPWGFIPRKLAADPSGDQLIMEILKLVESQDVQEIVLGEPARTDGRANDFVTEIREFGDKLSQAAKIPLHYLDERYTSVLAARTFSKGEKSAKKRAEIDGRAAAILLGDYLRRCAIIGEIVSNSDRKESEARCDD